MSMIRFLPVLILAGLPLATAAAEPGQAARYRACMEKTETYPKDAFEDAIQWRDMGGGGAAEHCAATALIQIGLYKDAADRLERLAQQIRQEPAFKAELLGQATQAWLLAELPARAEATATAALGLLPDNVDLLLDRAEARAALADYAGARADLDAAIKLDPNRADAFAFRAAARRYQDDAKGAMADVEQALKLNINHPPALLERGNLRRLAGDDDGARADWLMVLSLSPEGAAADAARSNLEKMDVNVK